MLKRTLILGVCAVLAAASASADSVLTPDTKTAAAATQQTLTLTPGWYVVSICAADARLCPAGPNPIYIGPYSTHATCLTAWAVWNVGYVGTYPRYLISDCIQY
jgi:hypothetical protein